MRTRAWVDLCQAEEEAFLEAMRAQLGDVAAALPAPGEGPQAEEEAPGRELPPPRLAAGASHRLPPLPHEVLPALVPGLRELIPSLPVDVLGIYVYFPEGAA